jgi:hypothetical protein
MEASAIKHYVDFVTKLLTICIWLSGNGLFTSLEFFLWDLIFWQPLPKYGEELNYLVLFLESIVQFLFTH